VKERTQADAGGEAQMRLKPDERRAVSQSFD